MNYSKRLCKLNVLKNVLRPSALSQKCPAASSFRVIIDVKYKSFSCLMLGVAYLTFQDSEMSDIDPAPGPETGCMEGENAPLYCICRKPDINCFMM